MAAVKMQHPNLPGVVLNAPTPGAARVWRTRGWVDKESEPAKSKASDKKSQETPTTEGGA